MKATSEVATVDNGLATVLAKQWPDLFRANIFAWLFLAIFGLVARLLLYNDTVLAIVMTIVLDPIGFTLTSFFHAAVSRRGTVRVGPRLVVLGIIFCFAAALVQMIIGGGVLSSLGIMTPWRDNGVAVIPGLYYFAIFVGWFLLYVWVITSGEARAAETRRILAEANADRAELDRLRTQLDPHVLYNTLNTIAAEIHDNPDRALDMTRQTAIYLRDNLENHEHLVCSLAKEIESVRTYLRIQECRFELPFRFELDVSAETSQRLLPRLALQVLVENAFKHGERSDLRLRITASLEADSLVLLVSNHGRLQSSIAQPGIGLANLRRRLDLHFPDRHRLLLRQEDDAVVAELVLEGTPCFA